jgi:uncharacterized membrane protein YdjX (TVP38/TMEM64 family)
MLKLAALIAIIAVIVLIAWHFGFFELRHPSTLARAVRGLRGQRFVAPLFVVAYAAATTFGLPGSAFTLAGGAIFGFWWGSVLNWIGATLGATTAYLFARALCGDSCRELLGRYEAKLQQAAAEHGFMAMLRLRLIPVIPFNLLNYAAALAGVRLRAYLVATMIGIIPAMAIYTYFADALLGGVAGATRHALLNVSMAGALLILLSFVPAAMQRWRRGKDR